MEMTKNEKIKKQINFAYMDEGKHYKMFQQIYYVLTGKMMEIPQPHTDEYSKLIDAVETSINGELEAVELYRKIQSMLPNQKLRDMLFEIITDEQEHATRFVYLFSILNK
jgi:rubrerythrin